jgi:membrane protease YdiL (CAAX protease family)
MSDAVPPPLPEQFLPPPTPEPRARWRWAVHLALLTSYVLGLGITGAVMRSGAKGSKEAAMPADLRSLVMMCGLQLAAFAVVFLLAWLFSRARRDELLLRWRGRVEPLAWGIIYSVLLRVVITMLMMLVLVPIYLKKGPKAIEEMRPKTEATVNMKAMKDPLYVAFAVTVVSFVMAGFTEELWRAGMLAGLAGIAPNLFGTPKGKYWAVAIAAVIFGFGHLPQGLGGVGVTAALGLGLGLIMVRHQSAWEAILAHGFFDASTFAALYVVVNYFPESLKGLAIVG